MTQLRPRHLLLALALASLPVEPALAACPGSFEQQVVDLINLERTARGLAPLSHDERLLEAARRHSADMSTGNFMSHTGSDGSNAGQRIDDAGYDWFTWGENIAFGYPNPASVVAAWMDSSGHRANILNPNFVHIGVGHVDDGVDFWTQAFAAGDTLVASCGEPPVVGGGPPPPSGAPAVDCAGAQLAAGARLCRHQLRCWSRLAGKPGADPGGARLAACLNAAANRFAQQWDDVRRDAAADGGACRLDETGSARAAAVEAQLQGFAGAVVAGANTSDKNDGKLRADLLGKAGSLCSSACSAEARNADKPDAARLAAARTKARTKFDAKTAKALGKASAKGVGYGGPSPVSLGNQIEALLGGWVADSTP
jgi:hypothetical protein